MEILTKERTPLRWGIGHPQASAQNQPAAFQAALDVLDQATAQAFYAYVELVKHIPSVEQVRAHVAGAYLHLFTYVSHSTEEERFAVYDCDKQFYDRYPDLRLEFDLIDRRGYPLSDGESQDKYVAIIRQLTESPHATAPV
jgi:hypothetical protein